MQLSDSITENVSREQKLYNVAFYLSLFTIFYNIIEGSISTYLGYQDDSLALFGFGVDSFIESLSGVGIAVMILRMRSNPKSHKGQFEVTALKITGIAFYILSAGLLVGAAANLLEGRKPETTFWGVVISLISIVVMLGLMYGKNKVGRELNSKPILADSNCTRACIYMSIVLLVSSFIYELTGIGYIDVLGTLGIVYFAISEGRECFKKAKGIDCCC
jgi:divalent metal cation (Fe/Co/Zn/Cd) transporter